jgi:hypothetical protein
MELAQDFSQHKHRSKTVVLPLTTTLQYEALRCNKNRKQNSQPTKLEVNKTVCNFTTVALAVIKTPNAGVFVCLFVCLFI